MKIQMHNYQDYCISPDENWKDKKYPFSVWEKSPSTLTIMSNLTSPEINEIYNFLLDNGVEFVIQQPDCGIHLWRLHFTLEEGKNFFLLNYGEWFR